ncbi:hypothetical protein EYF80_063828 [Liparis tanakae]|uniref:Uncharacterized protein n=1 Tax=Liparis tanakae TaxID=230148 RepID=A0A4Z2EB18_9TELE|nr:hypothetical protein EYF80_063828 [Liparis tanakae]
MKCLKVGMLKEECFCSRSHGVLQPKARHAYVRPAEPPPPGVPLSSPRCRAVNNVQLSRGQKYAEWVDPAV